MNWPDSLPNPVISDYSESCDPLNLSTVMLSGRTFVRKRFSKSVLTTKMTFVMTETQKALFESFYNDELNKGTKQFNLLSKDRLIVGAYSCVPFGRRYKLSFTTESYV